MKIAIIAGQDIGGLGANLSKYMNEHTKHKVTNMIGATTYLNYPYDKKIDGKFTEQSGGYLLKQEDILHATGGGDDFDFYIMRWLNPNTIYDLFKTGKFHKGNTLIKLHGSECRMQPFAFSGLWQHTGVTLVSTGYDYRMNKDLGFVVQHIPVMVDCRKLWDLQVKASLNSDKMVLGHFPTDPAKKGTMYLEQARSALVPKGGEKDIVWKFITGKSWEDAIIQKASCHVVFDQISSDIGIGTLGANTLEALAMSKIVLEDHHSFTYSMYPELEHCAGRVTKDTLAETIYALASNRALWDGMVSINKPGLDFVRSRFDIPVVAAQWKFLIEFLYEEGVSDGINLNVPASVTPDAPKQ